MIPGIGSLGGAELLIALAIILLIFGAKRLPELGRSLGLGLTELRKEAAGLGDEEKAEPGPQSRDGKRQIVPGAAKKNTVSERTVDESKR
jgi:sec-independent protein translocase protein TatA